MKPLRILLIEPAHQICCSISPALQADDHVVVVMNDVGVLAHIDTFIQVDLIIVDADSDADRITELESLMKQLRFRNRILAVVSNNSSEVIDRLHRAGAGNVLIKPTTSESLDHAIRSIIASVSV